MTYRHKAKQVMKRRTYCIILAKSTAKKCMSFKKAPKQRKPVQKKKQIVPVKKEKKEAPVTEAEYQGPVDEPTIEVAPRMPASPVVALRRPATPVVAPEKESDWLLDERNE